MLREKNGAALLLGSLRPEGCLHGKIQTCVHIQDDDGGGHNDSCQNEKIRTATSPTGPYSSIVLLIRALQLVAQYAPGSGVHSGQSQSR